MGWRRGQTRSCCNQPAWSSAKQLSLSDWKIQRKGGEHSSGCAQLRIITKWLFENIDQKQWPQVLGEGLADRLAIMTSPKTQGAGGSLRALLLTNVIRSHRSMPLVTSYSEIWYSVAIWYLVTWCMATWYLATSLVHIWNVVIFGCVIWLYLWSAELVFGYIRYWIDARISRKVGSCKNIISCWAYPMYMCPGVFGCVSERYIWIKLNIIYICNCIQCQSKSYQQVLYLRFT